jgi:hypothetical protein
MFASFEKNINMYHRREILESENSLLIQNREALNFIRENGPDTLINCISINFRTWDKDRYSQHQTMYQNQANRWNIYLRFAADPAG